MISRIAFLAAAGLLAVACASNPVGSDSGSSAPADTGAATAPAPAAPSAVTVANLAATTWWYAEDKLIPEDPVLALVNDGVENTDQTAGLSVVCRAANGTMAMHIGKQPGTRLGQTATFKVRSGASTRDVEGKFQAGPKAGESDFVFPITSADLLALGQPDMVSFVSDQGEVQWALVKQPGVSVQAKYIGSMKGFAREAGDFLVYCNPK
jgi:hypothetical protein